MTDPLHQLQERLRVRLNPAQLQELEELWQAFQEQQPEGSATAFEQWLSQQGWALPGTDSPVEALLQTITADLGQEQAEGLHLGRQHYALLGRVGAGATGQIDLVREALLQRKVAMKLMKDRHSPEQLWRFLREAQITAQLDHPHIVPVYTLENTPTGLAYTMKRVQGRTFSAYIAEARRLCEQGKALEPEYSLSQRLEYFLGVCEALAYAHARGVIHRELEPDNLMIGNYREVYVLDWGFARVLPDSPLEILLPPELAGAEVADAPLRVSSAWISPEQALGAWSSLDQRSDLYGLGLILQALVCLRAPLQGRTPLELLEKASRAELIPARNPRGRRLPVDLQAILAQATAREPERRYASVEDLSHDLKRFLRGESVSARRDTPLQAAGRWLVRHQLLALSSVLGLILLSACLGIWSLWSQQQELLRIRRREVVINRFLGAVYAQSRTMNRQFLKAESQLEALASVAVSHFSQRRPAQAPYFLHGQFTPPEPLVNSRQYHSQISIHWPLSVKSWHIPESRLRESLASLAALRHLQLRILQESKTSEPLAPRQLETLIAQTGTPVSYATLVLRQGAGSWLPGGDFKGERYDPIQRPFYQFAAHQPARRWGNPYIDVSGAGLLLIVATGLFDHQHRFLGTASLDVKFDTLIQTMLDLPPALKQLRGSYLLDERGRVAISSSQKGQTFSATIHPNLKLPLYPHAPVVTAIRHLQSGHRILPGAHPLLVAYFRIPALGWYYVVEADLERLLAAAAD